ncbi:MAG: hypothetical protein L0Y74_06335 [candidate division Zixibacteria bacterium]|nr:hypothetical protein [candidate division Zixibacteria bacterium]
MVKTKLSGQFLVIEQVTQGQNKVARPFDDSVSNQSKYFSVNVSLNKFTLNQNVSLNMSKATSLFVRATKVSDGSRLPIRINIDETSGQVSVVSNDIRASILILEDCDVVALSLDNDTPDDANVEIVAAG